ncbi:MAG: regulatory iron-sulfur-containing complex subunit RicT, partial [Candidatus Margulisbacteria bacterium]|nr:regulatory iron-sulfur-containing complex subunit RicT [Candidatus Margulisiibacteriota bacterium]
MNENLKLGIRLRKFNRVCPITGYREESIKVGSPVIVQTDRGIEYGEIVSFTRGFPKTLSRDVRLKKVVRYATAEDVAKEKSIEEMETKSYAAAVQKANEYELPIRIINIEYLFDTSRAIVYYRAGESKKAINLRDFSRELSTIFSARVDLRQISPRDEAKLFGGLGPCGRGLCCSAWLEKPRHVTVKMAKEQGLSISPTKTAG